MKTKQTGIYQRRPKDDVIKNHAQIIKLKQQGHSLISIAKTLGTTYGSVLYVVYRKENNGLWQ
jgi:hypothetical protein